MTTNLNTKIFADTSERVLIQSLMNEPLVKGFTTNPSLMKKAGVKNYKDFCKDLLQITKSHPVSFEIFADEFPEMERQAREITTWGSSVYVKIPITNSKGESSVPLIQKLTKENIKLNITAIFTIDQVRQTCEALKGGSSAFISVFAGRIADTGVDPLPLMKEANVLCRQVGSAELLWASSRELLNIFQANEIGCPIITVAPDILKKLNQIGRDPKQLSLETVRTFKADAAEAGFQL